MFGAGNECLWRWHWVFWDKRSVTLFVLTSELTAMQQQKLVRALDVGLLQMICLPSHRYV